jgi:hypothetical protein
MVERRKDTLLRPRISPTGEEGLAIRRIGGLSSEDDASSYHWLELA